MWEGTLPSRIIVSRELAELLKLLAQGFLLAGLFSGCSSVNSIQSRVFFGRSRHGTEVLTLKCLAMLSSASCTRTTR